MPAADIHFLATSKSGLGHLRRSATIARRLRAIDPAHRLHLVSNAQPEGLSADDLGAFDALRVIERDRMATAVGRGGVLVLDTLTVPGIEALGLPLALVLREAPPTQLQRFRLAGGRPWDLLLVANPPDHWMPPECALPASSRQAVGWIYRPTGQRQSAPGKTPSVLVATGGGGTAETARAFHAGIGAVLSRVRDLSDQPFEVVQAIGPRARDLGQLALADRVLDPGPQLNEAFREADVVISTAGYNSVLELATTDTPTLLVPIPRSIDDQTARARDWAALLGGWHDAERPETSVRWLVQAIADRRRRPPVDLGPSGEDAAARAILALG